MNYQCFFKNYESVLMNSFLTHTNCHMGLHLHKLLIDIEVIIFHGGHYLHNQLKVDISLNLLASLQSLVL